MLPFERKALAIVLTGLDDAPDTLEALNDKELFTSALTRYFQLQNPDRDMYRETLDDLMDFARGKKPFRYFPPKLRSEGKYYIDYWRKSSHPSRWKLYRQRKWVLSELTSYSIIDLLRRPWQSVFIRNAHILKRLQALIAELEDRCFQLMDKPITVRLEYDEAKRQLIEHTPRGPIIHCTLKSGKLPERFIQCLLHNPNRELTHKNVYALMNIMNKKHRRIPLWWNDMELNRPALSGRFFHWIDADRIRFTPEHRSSSVIDDNKHL